MNRKQVLIAVGLAIIAAVVLAVRWEQLPDLVATHWGPSGAADEYTSKGWGLATITLGLPVIVAVAVVLAALVGMLTYRLADPPPPAPRRSTSPPDDGPRLTGAGIPSWTGVARSGVGGWVALGVVGALTILLIFTGAWWVTFITAPAMVLVAANLNFDVTMGQSKLVVASRLRWPRIVVPLDEIAAATTTDVAFWKWGGFGFRSRRHATGTITRTGDGLDIERTDGHHLVITVDDPATAAATINSLAEAADAATD